MIFQERSLTFREYALNEPAPLSAIQEFVLDLLRDREDAAVFGAQAVNAYVDEPRMSQEVDILAIMAESLAEEIKVRLNERLQIATRVRSVPAVWGLGSIRCGNRRTGTWSMSAMSTRFHRAKDSNVSSSPPHPN